MHHKKHTLVVSIVMLAALASVAAKANPVAFIEVTTTEDKSGDKNNCSLREAFDNVNAGGKVGTNNCAAGVKTVNNESTQINIPDGVKVDAQIFHSANWATVNGGSIDGQNKTRIFNVQNQDGETRLHLWFTELKHGDGDGGSGGAVLVSGGAGLFADYTVFRESHSDEDGEHIAIDGANGNLEITDCAFYDGTAGSNGGAIYASGIEDAHISNTEISGNTAFLNGGGIYSANAPMAIEDSRIENNKASYYGGGMYSFGYLSMNRVLVGSNRAEPEPDQEQVGSEGGGIYLEDAAQPTDATIFNSRITSNSAETDGGGIHAGSGVEIHGTTISYNSAKNGGGLWSNGGVTNDVTAIYNTSFIGNTAKVFGAALEFSGDPQKNTPDNVNPLGANYSVTVLNNTFSINSGPDQIHLDDTGTNSDGDILFVNNIVDGKDGEQNCGGYVKRLRTKRLNDNSLDVYGAQYPGLTCGLGVIPIVQGSLFGLKAGWFFHQEYYRTASQMPGDSVVCAAIKDVDQFQNKRKCLSGAVEQVPSITLDPDVYSP